MSAAGLILAAGESLRMGFPKALLRYHGQTFVDRLGCLMGARCSPVIVVLGAAAEQIRAGASCAATFVVNGDFARGQTSSMQCGLRAVPADAEGVLFTLVDHPAVAAATIDALVAGSNGGAGPLLRVPRYRGRRGHPVWFARALIAEFLALPETGAAREVVQRHADETEFVDLDDPGIVADIDDPEAYRLLTGGGA